MLRATTLGHRIGASLGRRAPCKRLRIAPASCPGSSPCRTNGRASHPRSWPHPPFIEAACHRSFTSTSQPTTTDAASRIANPEPAPATTPRFQPRRHFPLPTTIPSWYAGHMARAMRSMPYLLSRYPPPLVIEARDARLPLTSINPQFENLLRKAPAAGASFSQQDEGANGEDDDDVGHGWDSRRLIVYTKRDLIDPKLEEPIRKAFAKHGRGQEVLFVDTRRDRDVRKVLEWVQERARHLAVSPLATSPVLRSERAEKRAKATLSGAFRHTPTPEEGVRLVILGMPNVGKSSLLNALRRVGTGKGKAASTAPQPGHTRKLTGTVRISKHGPSLGPSREGRASEGKRLKESGRRDRSENGRGEDDEVEQDNEHGDSLFTLNPPSSSSSSFELQEDGSETGPSKESYDPPIYVYDTPGVMVPFLGRGDSGAQRAIKLAVAAGIKTSLFDVQMLADYLLFRMNLRYGYQLQRRAAPSSSSAIEPRDPPKPESPAYLTHMPLPPHRGEATNSINDYLSLVAERAPGTLNKGGTRDLDGAAAFFLQRWREGKVGDRLGELDFGIGELAPRPPPSSSGTDPVEGDGAGACRDDLREGEEAAAERIDRLVALHFESVERALLARERSRKGFGHQDEEHGHTPTLAAREGVAQRRITSVERSRSKALEMGSSMHQARKQIKRQEAWMRGKKEAVKSALERRRRVGTWSGRGSKGVGKMARKGKGRK